MSARAVCEAVREVGADFRLLVLHNSGVGQGAALNTAFEVKLVVFVVLVVVVVHISHDILWPKLLETYSPSALSLCLSLCLSLSLSRLSLGSLSRLSV
jgi:hypothetical protein